MPIKLVLIPLAIIYAIILWYALGGPSDERPDI